MTRALGLVVLALGGLCYAVPDASACHRSSQVVYYTPCHTHCWLCWPCEHHHHHHCIAFTNPYALTGAMWVRCEGHSHPSVGSWHHCYVYRTGTYEWVKIRRCYPHGGPYDKEAEEAEGFKKAAAEMPGTGEVAVTVTPGAKLTYDGVADTATGATRQFQTTTLEPGQAGTFTFVAEYGEGDKKTVVRREVTVRAWETATVDLSAPAAATAAVATK